MRGRGARPPGESRPFPASAPAEFEPGHLQTCGIRLPRGVRRLRAYPSERPASRWHRGPPGRMWRRRQGHALERRLVDRSGDIGHLDLLVGRPRLEPGVLHGQVASSMSIPPHFFFARHPPQESVNDDLLCALTRSAMSWTDRGNSVGEAEPCVAASASRRRRGPAHALKTVLAAICPALGEHEAEKL
jgi:hypothetical protein